MWRYSRQLIRHIELLGVPCQHSLLGRWHSQKNFLQLIGAEILEPCLRIFSSPHIALHPYNVLPFLSPKCQGAQLLVVHDLIFMNAAFRKSMGAKYRSIKIERSIDKAHKVICHSETTQRTVESTWPDVSTMLIPAAFDDAFETPLVKKSRSSTFRILHFGGTAVSKGTALLINAVARLVAKGYKVHLTIAAMSQNPTFIRRIANACELATEHYSVLPRLSDEELATLYRNCDLHCMPSLAEGFGLPVIEAASRALPSLLSPLPIFREIMGDSALYLENCSDDSITAGLIDAIQQDLVPLGLKAKAKATEYSFSVVHARYAKPSFEALLEQVVRRAQSYEQQAKAIFH
jgi:glycosyltransferase involved in cell wall biosynthesis